jgi:SagB-type dehydrogenase family enzyme
MSSSRRHTLLFRSDLPGLGQGMSRDDIAKSGGVAVQARAHALLAKLARLGRLDVVLQEGARALAILHGVDEGFVLSSRRVVEAPIELSRPTCMRVDAGSWVAESPLVGSRLEIVDERAGALLLSLARPRTLAQLEREHGAWASALVELLFAGKLVDEAGREADELATWEFHDLLLHGHRRWARTERVGGTYRLLDRIPSPPPLRPDFGGPKIPLGPPRFALDRSLGAVLEQRRSEREQGEPAITIEALGALLHHVARLRGMHEGPHGPLADRPFPSAGARHPLEIWVCVGECVGLDRGLHHYDPASHALEPMPGDADAMLAVAQIGTRPAQVLLVITARFARTSWKYETNAHSLILQEVGVLLQTLHLGATALDLASCLVDRNLCPEFERATGLAFHVESPLGALSLGSRGVPT